MYILSIYIFRLEGGAEGAMGHLRHLCCPALLLHAFRVWHALYGPVEEGLACHDLPPLPHHGTDRIFICGTVICTLVQYLILIMCRRHRNKYIYLQQYLSSTMLFFSKQS